jgi:DNA polymerase III subunit chi
LAVWYRQSDGIEQRREGMTEIYFYHLERQPLDKALINLIERSIGRGWSCVVQAGSEERVDALDTLLWTYEDESFLPHGTVKDGHPELQKVFLTTSEDNPNGAQIRFVVDGAALPDVSGYQRAVYMFDGHDEAAVVLARQQWKAAKDQGHTLSYWQQDQDGRWVNRASG